MVDFECYDEYGNLVHTQSIEATNFKTVIIKHGERYYRPVCYDLSERQIAKCTPVEVIETTN